MGGTEAIMIASAVAGKMEVDKQQKQEKEYNQKMYQIQRQQSEADRSARVAHEKKTVGKKLASNRARFGGAGLSSYGGSAGALLDGMRSQARENISQINTHYGGSMNLLNEKYEAENAKYSSQNSLTPILSLSQNLLSNNNNSVNTLKDWD